MAQEHISQVSDEFERRVTKKLSKEVSRTESRILGFLSKLDEFLLNPQIRTCSVAVPGTSRNSDSENREPTGDRSPNDPYPKAVFSSHHSGNKNGSELKETHLMVTGVQEEIPYCSPGTSSGKQKKTRSTSQPQFGSENTPATIEADRLLLALQHLTTNSSSANFQQQHKQNLQVVQIPHNGNAHLRWKSEYFELF